MFSIHFSFRHYFETLHSFTFRINPFRKDSGLILQTYWLGRLILLGVLICTINGILQFLIPLNLILLHLLIRHLTLLVISNLILSFFLMFILIFDGLLISLIISIDLLKLLHFGLLLVFTSLNLNLVVDIRKIISIVLSFSWIRLKSLKMEKYNICIWFILIILLIIFLNYLFEIFLIIGIIFLKLFLHVATESKIFIPKHVY